MDRVIGEGTKGPKPSDESIELIGLTRSLRSLAMTDGDRDTASSGSTHPLGLFVSGLSSTRLMSSAPSRTVKGFITKP